MLLLALSACGTGSPTLLTWPELTLSEASLDFGDTPWGTSVERTVLVGNAGGMPMGVRRVAAGDGGRGFTVSVDADAIDCAGTVAKAVDVDTGSPPRDTGGRDTAVPRSDTAEPGFTLLVLDPGCQVPVTVTYTPVVDGPAYDALVVDTVGAEDASSYFASIATEDDTATPPLPAYLADPVHTRGVTWLAGTTALAEGHLVVTPRSVDFGFVYPGRSASADLVITNVGTGPSTLGAAELWGTCDPSFTLAAPTTDTVLAPSESAVVTVTYTPTTIDPAYCQVWLPLDGVTEDVTLSGDSGSNINTLPTVSVVSPANGQLYATTAPLPLTLAIGDAEQPPSSLACTVSSAVLRTGVLGDCTPTDDSGFVTVDLAAAGFGVGSDTLLITVEDAQYGYAYASVSVVIDQPLPTDDGDGDGFGGADDCDDADAATFPAAQELYDGADNDCDGVVDEGTEGSDDDGDHFSEAEGDCDDRAGDVYPGAPERGDGLDNDCDGVADETTSLFDDDGDGYDEADGDCDDNDAAVNPSAAELCDGRDNDCDGARDAADGCTGGGPYFAGDVIAFERSAVHEGDVVAAEVRAYDPAGGTLTYAWSDDSGGTFDDSTAARVGYATPGVEFPGRNVNLYAVVRDDAGQQDWTFDKLAVYDVAVPLGEPFPAPASRGCGGAGFVGFGLLGASLFARRRRG